MSSLSQKEPYKLGQVLRIQDPMLIMKTIKAILGIDGRLHLPERVKLSRVRRVLVTFLDESSVEMDSILASQMSERALATDWNRPEEDEAWQHLQFDPS